MTPTEAALRELLERANMNLPAQCRNLKADIVEALSQPSPASSPWDQCKGTCARHQSCMYTPWRSLSPVSPTVQQAAEAMAVNWDELGHTADAVRDAGRVALGAIISFGASHKMAELIVEHVAKFRHATPQPTETQRIVAWLRKDASETRDDVRRLHAARKLTIAQTAEWENLIALKGGIADAIERGAHLAGEKS